MNSRKIKRESAEVDKLVMEVDKLVAGGMSVNKACHMVELQNTVYYFRKRRNLRIATADTQATTDSPSKDFSHSEYIEYLCNEAKRAEEKLQEIKLLLAEAILSGGK